MAPPSGTSLGGPSSSGGMNRGNGSAGRWVSSSSASAASRAVRLGGLRGRRRRADRQADEAAQDVGQLACLGLAIAEPGMVLE